MPRLSLLVCVLVVSACATTQPEYPADPPLLFTDRVQFVPVTSPPLRDVRSVEVFQVGQDVGRPYDVVVTATRTVAYVRYKDVSQNTISTARQEQEALLELRRAAASRDADAIIVRLRDEELMADASDAEYSRRSVRRYYEASLIRYRAEG